ncbi:helix-turn-helix transcriptional regulator [Belliella sp. R4-6]|uniref:Helix-turn-helix transcriptional regulator n=1 Tax=Belliella alkalica TaxID=1730871 RepID=A0ABS9VEZ0_9BACT|nr:helix-turn-helix transcriptional regulator [Belliella alkalica]MCH7415016.1 helix-turn-helix transcriptional regulator [Belliella alkalica]
MRKKDPETAFDYIKEQVQLAEQIGRYVFLVDAYASMAQYYFLIDDELQYLRYKAKGKEFNDLLNNKKELGVGLTVDTLIRLNDDKIKTISKRNNYLLISYLFGFVVLVFYFYWLNERKKHEMFIVEEDVRLMQLESNELKKKVDNTYDEVIAMAKANDSAFLARFQEVFKPIFSKLEKLTPSLTTEELKLCAMLYFNFSTKDIANFTFVQTKTIQMKKYRLRKKLNIDSSVDLSEWVRNL